MLNVYENQMAKRYGQRYLDYRKIYKSADSDKKLCFPLEIDFDFYDGCNLHCPGCHSIGRKRSNKKMSRELICQIAEECGKNGMPAVNIGGCSEPLVDVPLTLFSISEFKKNSIMDIFLHTNGTLMTENVSKALIDAGVTYLCVSIDAATQETFSKMRGANYYKLVENVYKFLEVRGGGGYLR